MISNYVILYHKYKLVYEMQSTDKGNLEAQTFCGIINLLLPPTQYSKKVKVLLTVPEQVCNESMQNADEKAV